MHPYFRPFSEQNKIKRSKKLTHANMYGARPSHKIDELEDSHEPTKHLAYNAVCNVLQDLKLTFCWELMKKQK